MKLLSSLTACLDICSNKSLNCAAVYVESIQATQGYQIANLEEVAFLKGWFGLFQLEQTLSSQDQSSYIQYLREILQDPGHRNPNSCAA